MKSELDRIRESYQHPGNKGSEAESTLRDFLGLYLPIYNRIGHGEVFNLDGARSRQTDLVITNEYHPPLYADWSRPQLFIIEGVACVGEVKTCLNSSEDLRSVFDAATQFKRILVQPQEGALLYAVDGDINRFVTRRPFFLFLFESRLTLDQITEKLSAWDSELRAIERPVVDAIFILNLGSIINLGQGKGSLKIKGTADVPKKGYVIRPWAADVLPMLLIWIFTSMPKLQLRDSPLLSYLLPKEGEGPLTLRDDGSLRRNLTRGPGAPQN